MLVEVTVKLWKDEEISTCIEAVHQVKGTDIEHVQKIITSKMEQVISDLPVALEALSMQIDKEEAGTDNPGDWGKVSTLGELLEKALAGTSKH